MRKNNRLRITVGIPTCYGGQSLVDTVKSLRASSFKDDFEIAIEADRIPWTKNVKNSLKKMGVRSHWNNVEGSQCKKLKQIISKMDSDIFVFTQDDIIFDTKTLNEIYWAFSNDSGLTMVGARVLPLKPITFFESVMGVMLRAMDRIITTWNNGDNYLMANGRCLAFKTSFLKKFRITDRLINTDAFMYLENKYLGGKFRPLKQAKVYIRTPQSIKDQEGPSSRFQYSKEEMSEYFARDLTKEYKVPLNILFMAALKEFANNPVHFFAYVLVYIYTRLKKQPKQKALKTLWKIDESTKTSIQV
ncbi:hypothetical protein HYS91_05905 [Candidatus Daviesbacteria bacterium]|nr:hypothetical protein [Candidatus Daviesbacteria bacterium]